MLHTSLKVSAALLALSALAAIPNFNPAQAGQIPACSHNQSISTQNGDFNASSNYRAGFLCEITVNGTFTNRFGAKMTGSEPSRLLLKSGATVQNQGTMNRMSIKNADFSGSALFVNTGTMTSARFSLNPFIRAENRGTINNGVFGNTADDQFTNMSGGVINYLSDGGTRNVFNSYTMALGGVVNILGKVNLTDQVTQINSGTINVESGTILEGEVYTIEGTLDNRGQVNNTGMTNVTGSLDNSGTLLNDGTVDNSGTLTNQTGGLLDNNAALNNTGILTLQDGSTVDNTGGTIDNNDQGQMRVEGDVSLNGTVNNNTGGTLTVVAGAELTNNATLSNTGLVDNAGTFNNNSTLTNSEAFNNTGDLNNNAAIINAGTLDNDAAVTSKGIVFNQNTIDNAGTFLATAVLQNEASGTINNSDLLEIDPSQGNQNDAFLINKGTLNNTANGTVDVKAGGLFTNETGAAFNNAGKFSNSGTFRQTTGTSTVGGTIINQGIFDGGAGVTLTGDVSGAGSFEGSITMDGTFGPGNSPALVTAETLAFGASSALMMEIGGLARGTEYDAIDALSVTLDGLLNVTLLDLANGFSPMAGDTFDLIIADSIFGSFSSFAFASLSGGLAFAANFIDNIGAPDIFQLIVVAQESGVPTPGALILFGIGLCGMGISRQRSKAAHQI